MEKSVRKRRKLKSRKAHCLGQPLKPVTLSLRVAIFPEHGSTEKEIIKPQTRLFAGPKPKAETWWLWPSLPDDSGDTTYLSTAR